MLPKIDLMTHLTFEQNQCAEKCSELFTTPNLNFDDVLQSSADHATIIDLTSGVDKRNADVQIANMISMTLMIKSSPRLEVCLKKGMPKHSSSEQ